MVKIYTPEEVACEAFKLGTVITLVSPTEVVLTPGRWPSNQNASELIARFTETLLIATYFPHSGDWDFEIPEHAKVSKPEVHIEYESDQDIAWVKSVSEIYQNIVTDPSITGKGPPR